MRFHHDRAAGRERRGRVAAGHREREREIAGAEHGDRSHRNPLHAQIGTRQRLAVRQRRIERRGKPLARAHYLRKQLELRGDCAATLLVTRLGKSVTAILANRVS